MYIETGATPERSLAQRMEALHRANEIRSHRATLKRDLKAGRTRVDRIVRRPPEYTLTMKVYDLLVATPKYGRVKANRLLQQCRVSPSKTLGGMTDRQRTELLDLLINRP